MEFHPTATDSNVVARFTFFNARSYPVTVLTTKISCGSCTLAKLDKKAYQPGERGELTATFNFGQRIGLQTKNIVVQTDDRSEPNTLLSFKVHVPEMVRISPVFVYWLAGAAKVAKTIAIKVVNDQPINILFVKSTNDRLTAKLKTVKAGSEYTGTVVPTDTSQAAIATLQIETDYPKERPRTFQAYAMVKDVARP